MRRDDEHDDLVLDLQPSPQSLTSHADASAASVRGGGESRRRDPARPAPRVLDARDVLLCAVAFSLVPSTHSQVHGRLLLGDACHAMQRAARAPRFLGASKGAMFGAPRRLFRRRP